MDGDLPTFVDDILNKYKIYRQQGLPQSDSEVDILCLSTFHFFIAQLESINTYYMIMWSFEEKNANQILMSHLMKIK